MKSFKVTIFVLLGCSALVFSAEEYSDVAKTLPVVHRDDCDAVLGLWVGSVKPTFKSDSLTLDVDVTSLYDALKLKNCFSYDQLWLELWWVTDIAQNPRPNNFGSVSYFSMYERCHQLEPEHFVFHSSKQLDSNFHDENGPKNVARFNHIVEREYILRICPCGRRQSGVNICDCKYSVTEKPHCGKIIKVDAGSDAVVYPWCQMSSASTTSHDNVDNVTTKMVVHSPVVNCTSVLFTGVMASCTPLQPYDRVKLSLHLVKPETILGFECNRHQHFGSNNPIVIETSIHNINGSHGDFSVYLSVLAPQSVYCLQIELLDHPYCNSHLTIGHGLGSVPRVCASHMAHPVITPKCTDAHGGQIVKRAGNSYYLIGILAVGLAALIGVGVICVVCAILKMRRRASSSGKGPHGKEYHIPRQVSGYSCHSLDAVPGFGLHEITTDQKFQDIFLLRLPHSSCSDDVHNMFVDWLESIGCHVHDMANPDDDEYINADPEGWVHEILSMPDVKVVVIEGDLADIVDKEMLARSPLMLEQKVGPPSSSTATSSLADSASSSMDGRISKSHDDSQSEDTDPLLDDPRHELRIFAWKFIQNNFVGKYNQIILVRFCHIGGRPPNSETVLSLTPFRQSFLVPHHLPEIRKWLRPSKNSAKTSSSESAKSVLKSVTEKKIESCERKLRSSLRVSQFENCI